MVIPEAAEHALDRASATDDLALRRLWVVAAIEALLDRRLVIVGGVAVDLHTGQYWPTDIDLIGSLSKSDRAVLRRAGFTEEGSRHMAWSPDGERPILVEFLSSTLDGDYELIELEPGVTVAVINLEGIVVDRLQRATHPNSVAFDEAVALVAAVGPDIDWRGIAKVIRSRPDAEYLGLPVTTARVLERAGMIEDAMHFTR